MRLKFENVDVEACLHAIMECNTKHYQSDFEYDKAAFLKAVQSENKEDKTLYWMSRESGTWCFKERDIFIRDSEAFHTWQYYKDGSDSILAYAVEITGTENGKAIGTLYTQDYRALAEHIDRAALPADTVTLRFQGDEQTYQFAYRDYFDHRYRIHDEHGRATLFRLAPNEPDILQSMLQSERAYRQKSLPGVFEAYKDKLFGKEKQSVAGRLRAAARQVADQPAQTISKGGQER